MFNKSKALAWSLLAATFLLGAVVGGVAMETWGDDYDGRRYGSREHVSYTDRLEAELALTSAQRESVQVILDRRGEAMHELWNEYRPLLDTLRDQIRGEIMSLLDEKQQETFSEMIAHSDSVREHGRRRSSRDQ
ncbi:MAG: periplasmic heavy metal sensor [Gemmatimonadales bacterium]|jgi:hypothetical protein